MDGPADSQIMNYVVRMVVPMRREFGRGLDVQQFLRDRRYADEVLAQALESQDPRLREYAKYVQSRMAGARAAHPPPGAPAAAAPAAGITVRELPPVNQGDEAKADELRQKVLKKYTGGLR